MIILYYAKTLCKNEMQEGYAKTSSTIIYIMQKHYAKMRCKKVMQKHDAKTRCKKRDAKMRCKKLMKKHDAKTT